MQLMPLFEPLSEREALLVLSRGASDACVYIKACVGCQHHPGVALGGPGGSLLV